MPRPLPLAHRDYRKTGVAITPRPDVTPTAVQFNYGWLRGAKTFDSLADLKAEITPWIAKHRTRLLAEVAELEKLERDLTRMEEHALQEKVWEEGL